MEGLCFVPLFVLLAIAAATLEQPPLGIRSILPTPSIGGFNEQPFFDKLGDTPGREVVIIGVESINISFYSRDDHGVEQGGVQYILVTYRLSNGSFYTAPRHGGNSCYGCGNVSIKLAPDEFIEKVCGKTDGIKINQITIHTRNAKVYERRFYGPFGSAGEKTFTFKGRVFGFFGNYGYYLNGIGALLLSLVKQSPYFGANGTAGTDFDDNPDYLYSTPVAKIMKVHIYSDNNTVNAIQAEYLLFDGRTVPGPLHGKNLRGIMSTISFGDSEVLTGILGVLSDNGNHVVQITFITRKRDGSNGKYGPYGGTSGTRPFMSYGYHILGFSGNVGETLNGISVYYQQYL